MWALLLASRRQDNVHARPTVTPVVSSFARRRVVAWSACAALLAACGSGTSRDLAAGGSSGASGGAGKSSSGGGGSGGPSGDGPRSGGSGGTASASQAGTGGTASGGAGGGAVAGAAGNGSGAAGTGGGGSVTPTKPGVVLGGPLGKEEHPRLVFRKDELATIRARAATPAGVVILQRLRDQIGAVENFFSAAGHCLLWLVTNDKAEADAARATVDKAVSLQLEKVGRFKWSSSTQTIDYGPAVRGVAMAYDLCYDAWPAEYRDGVAEKLADQITKLIAGGGPGYNANSPSSNWNPITHGSAAVAAMAIMGDPKGGDQTANLATLQGRIDGYLSKGVGDHGWGKEGQNYKRFASFEGLFPYFQATGRVLGKDLVSGRSSAEWLVPLWAMEIIPRSGVPSIPHRGPDHGYGDKFDSDGHFALGFPTVPGNYRPAVLWVYNHFVDPNGGKAYDTGLNWKDLSQSAIYSLTNWPFDETEASPNGILPRIVEDKQKGFYAFRSGWNDQDDVLVTLNLNSDPQSPSWQTADTQHILLWGMGANVAFPGPTTASEQGKASHVALKADGSQGTVTGDVGNASRALGVDFSGASGAPALFVLVDRGLSTMPIKATGTVDGNAFTVSGPGGGTLRGTVVAPAGAPIGSDLTVTCDTGCFLVLTAQKGAPPAVKVEGSGLGAKVTVGEQTVTFADGHVSFGK